MSFTILGVVRLACNSDLVPVPGSNTEAYAHHRTRYREHRHAGRRHRGGRHRGHGGGRGMRVEQVRAFVVLAEELNFRRAAARGRPPCNRPRRWARAT